MSICKKESDASLVARFRSGEDAAGDFLMRRYFGFVRYLTRRFSIVGGDVEDLIQEGMIGLFQAIIRYDESREMSFRNFAASCILSKLYSAVKADARKKNQPSLSKASLNRLQVGAAQLSQSASLDRGAHLVVA